MPLAGWVDTGDVGDYLNMGDRPIKIYTKTFAAGQYVLDNDSAMYLFEPVS